MQCIYNSGDLLHPKPKCESISSQKKRKRIDNFETNTQFWILFTASGEPFETPCKKVKFDNPPSARDPSPERSEFEEGNMFLYVESKRARMQREKEKKLLESANEIGKSN